MKLFAPLALACGQLLLAPAGVLAAASDKLPDYGESTPLDLPVDSGAQLGQTGGGSGGSLARTFIGLAVVVAVIYAVAWALRQVKSSKEERATGTGLSAVATVPLGPGRSVHLIRAGRELVLVGAGDQGVVPLRTYTEEEARSLGLLGEPDAAPAPSGRPAGLAGGLLEALRKRTAR